MSFWSVIHWGLVGFAVAAALVMLLPDGAPSLTLEGGLGPEVTTSAL